VVLVVVLVVVGDLVVSYERELLTLG